MRRILVSVASISAAVALAACGSSASSSSTTTARAAAGGSSPSQRASSASASSTAAATAEITTKHDKLGTVLAYGPKRLTLYLFEADKGPHSSCSGECAKVWPPVIGNPTAGGQAQASALGTIKRSDGTTQVTYHGHPLYLFIKDKDDGDAYGQGINGFGASWYAVAPSGEKVDNS